MIKEGKFGANEMICFVTIAMSSKVLFSLVSRLLVFSATSAWLMTIISCFSASILFIFVYMLLKRFPGKNIVEIYNATLGRAVGFVFSLVLFVAIFFCCSILAREFMAICVEYVFPNTPLGFIGISLLLPVAIGAYFGLESIVRFAKLTAYFAVVAVLMMIIMVLPMAKPENILPVMGYGLDVTIWEGLKRTCTYSEVVFIAILAGSLQGSRSIKKSAYISLLISCAVIASGLLLSVMVLSYPVAQEQMASVYAVSRQINLGDFFKRLDPLFLYLWFSTTIITVAAEFYCGLSVYCKTFKLQDHRPVVLPAVAIIYAASYIPHDFSAVEEALIFIRTYGFFVVFLMPIIALVVSLIRKKKGEPT